MNRGTKFLLSCFLFFLFIWISLRILLPLTLPFLLGTGLALLAEPGVRFLRQKTGLPRAIGAGLCVSAAFLLLSGAVFVLCALLLRQLQALGTILPNLQQTADDGLALLKNWLLELSARALPSLRPLLRRHILTLFSDSTAFLRQGISYILGLAGGLLSRVPDQAFTLFTAVVSGFMISAKLPALRSLLMKSLSERRLRAIREFGRRLRRTAGHWILAQLKLAGVTLLILTSGLIILKIPYAPILALSVALLDALPLLGTGAVLIPWSLISFLQKNTPQALGLLGLYGIVTLTRSLLEPRFVGRQLGLDPLATLAALYIGYRLWGFGGMILSPLLAVVALQLPQQGSEQKKTL